MRRQNLSCDQCRKSKKACDGAAVNKKHSGSGDDTSPASLQYPLSESGLLPCSYCAKTKKQCTLNWARAQLQDGSASSVSSASRPEQSGQAKRQRREHYSPSQTTGVTPSPTEAGAHILLGIPQTALEAREMTWNSAMDNFEGSAALLSNNPLSSLALGTLPFEDELAMQPSFQPPDDLLAGLYQGPQHTSELPTSTPFQTSHQDLSFLSWNLPHILPREYSGAPRTSRPARSVNDADQRYHKTHRRSNEFQSQRSYSPSPFDADFSLMMTANNHMISDNLLGVYHDVLEHNLSCWLTEDTCPYKMDQRMNVDLGVMNFGLGLPQLASPNNSGGGGTLPELGPSWSNRIYRRVIKLDRVAQLTKMISLTPSEDRAASKALHLVIMAFATQWTQGSRQEERYPSVPLGSPEFDQYGDFGANLSEEFDRNLQRSMWEHAKRALQEVADLECFRVVCAELIFGLTQKPWTRDEFPWENVATAADDENGHVRFIKGSVLPHILEIISKDGPPTYIERAARKMHALKFRFDATDTSISKTHSKYPKPYETNAIRSLGVEDRSTIGLLYWLAVMFDTVSSSMNERPVAVVDEDCQHDGAPGKIPTPPTPGSLPLCRRWDVDLFIQDDPDAPSQSLHWPCPYEVAARAVMMSAPVKVLLFRHVSYFQNSLRKKEFGGPIEDIIKSTLSVHRYWNLTYGAFFRDLIKNFDSVPSRIQSWFVVISAHWHLAALMLSDLIDFVDENELGLEISSQQRIQASMTARMRKSSAMELSDLARVATPSEETEPGLPEFHFAVNKGTILTEPWTIILIRAFAKASILHLGIAAEIQSRRVEKARAENYDDPRESLNRSENCIKALWFLGKKSDMSRSIAGVLSNAMHAIEVS